MVCKGNISAGNDVSESQLVRVAVAASWSLRSRDCQRRRREGSKPHAWYMTKSSPLLVLGLRACRGWGQPLGLAAAVRGTRLHGCMVPGICWPDSICLRSVAPPPSKQTRPHHGRASFQGGCSSLMMHPAGASCSVSPQSKACPVGTL